MGEAVGLQHLEQVAAAGFDPDPGEPGLEQAAGVLGADVGGDLALAGAALGDHPFGHLEDGGRVGGGARGGPLGVVEGAGGERHRGVRPLRGRTLFAPRLGVAVAQMGEKLFRRGGGRHLGPGAADVDAGVVVGAADPGAATRVDVDGGGHVQLRGARPVADLPDREELGESATVAPCERRRDVEEGVREGAGDPVLVKVRGTGLDVAGVGLQPLVVSESDPVTEDVNRLGLAGEADGQLLGDEGVGEVLELERPVDRVVIGDRHEVHPPPLGELVDLLRRGRALGQSERALDPEAGQLRGGGVAVQVSTGSHRCLPFWSCQYTAIFRHLQGKHVKQVQTRSELRVTLEGKGRRRRRAETRPVRAGARGRDAAVSSTTPAGCGRGRDGRV